MKKTTQGKKENTPEPRVISFEKHLYRVALARLRDKSDPVISSQELSRRLGLSDSPPQGRIPTKIEQKLPKRRIITVVSFFLKRPVDRFSGDTV